MAPLFCSYCHLVTKVCKKGQAVQILFRPCFSYKLTSNFCKDIRKMIYGIIPSKWDTIWQNQCPNSKVKNLTVIKFDFCISIKTAFQRPKAGSYETGDKMSLTHHKQIDKIRPHLDMRSETPFQFRLSHAVVKNGKAWPKSQQKNKHAIYFSCWNTGVEPLKCNFRIPYKMSMSC